MGGGRGLESSSSVRRGPMGFCWHRLDLRGAVSALIKGEKSSLVLLCSPPLPTPSLPSTPPLSSPLQGVSGPCFSDVMQIGVSVAGLRHQYFYFLKHFRWSQHAGKSENP